ncbi:MULTISPECIES: hypothetical protein [Halomonadaceae]|uniref:Uncharacterized protein n=1 Tax=Vreelandella halophila TaxID=86177 RepID=A0A9X4YCI9_9GAMM|nr:MULTISPECIES: hypothetical protein [Halomonas]MYL25400.1 hypothetical protein [Halomonas utahensis]MYL75127.1 hypothetical protein [Halomonas sp. 22501_18_FS]
MSEITLSLPDIPDSKVVLNEQEAREVLAFFWPSKKPILQNRVITLELRRYAQALLVVAVDGSYLMGFVEIAFDTLFSPKPGTSVKKLIRKVVLKSAKHWWEHASQEDLEDPTVYETIRSEIARKQKSVFELRLNGYTRIPPQKRRIVLSGVEPGTLAWT